MTTKPTSIELEQEPAVSIGKVFADKAMLQTYVSAIVSLAAGVLKFTVTDGLVEDITTFVMFAAMAWTPIMAQLEKKKMSTDQAKETREAVYAPSTVKVIAQASADTGEPMVPPPPAK